MESLLFWNGWPCSGPICFSNAMANCSRLYLHLQRFLHLQYTLFASGKSSIPNFNVLYSYVKTIFESYLFWAYGCASSFFHAFTYLIASSYFLSLLLNSAFPIFFNGFFISTLTFIIPFLIILRKNFQQHEQTSHEIGDQVWIHDSQLRYIFHGTVVQSSPCLVRPEGWKNAFTWDHIYKEKDFYSLLRYKNISSLHKEALFECFHSYVKVNTSHDCNKDLSLNWIIYPPQFGKYFSHRLW